MKSPEWMNWVRNDGSSVRRISRTSGGIASCSGSDWALTFTSSTKSLIARRTGTSLSSKTTTAFSPCGEKTVP